MNKLLILLFFENFVVIYSFVCYTESAERSTTAVISKAHFRLLKARFSYGNDNKLKKFYTVSAAIGYILCSLYAFIYCASYGLVHLHLPISSESVLSGVFDDFFYFSEATIVVLLVFAIVCVGSYLALLFIAFDKGHRPLPFRLSIIAFAAFGLSCAEFDKPDTDLRIFCTVLAAIFLLIGIYTAVLCVRNVKRLTK